MKHIANIRKNTIGLLAVLVMATSVAAAQRSELTGTKWQLTHVNGRAIATSEVDVVVLPVRVLDDIVRAHPVVAREIVRASENRVQQARIALQAVGEQLPFGHRVLG